jgi:hypothetical protein
MEAGPLPDRIEDTPAYTAAQLIRRCDPRLNALADAEISEIMALDDPGTCEFIPDRR